MRRRDFIALLGGAAAAWPLAARAQQPEQMRRIGVLMNAAADDPEDQAEVAAFQQVLQQLGWSDGRNVRIDTRWGENDVERKPTCRPSRTTPPHHRSQSSGPEVSVVPPGCVGNDRPSYSPGGCRAARDPRCAGRLDGNRHP